MMLASCFLAILHDSPLSVNRQAEGVRDQVSALILSDVDPKRHDGGLGIFPRIVVPFRGS
jgi:hypothetical protein